MPGPGERDPPGLVAGGEFVVDGQRRGTGGQAQHRVRLALQQRLDRVGGDPADLRGVSRMMTSMLRTTC